LEKGEIYEIPKLGVSVSANWLRLIFWVQQNMPHGQICYKVERGEPTELVAELTKRKVRFDKDNELPPNF
jgi:hypothetical protein